MAASRRKEAAVAAAINPNKTLAQMQEETRARNDRSTSSASPRR
jgi:hypothetical protein